MVSSSWWKTGRVAKRCFLGSEGLFHGPKLLGAQHGLERVQVGVGAQHENAIELRLRLGMVDGEVARADGGEKAAEPGVADQRLVAALELPLEALEKGRALGGVLRGLLVIAADDVACAVELDRLGFVIDMPATLLDGERHKGLWIREHEVTHQLVACEKLLFGRLAAFCGRLRGLGRSRLGARMS